MLLLNNSTNQKSLFAAVSFSTRRCDQLSSVQTKFRKYATYLTVQTGTDRHITLIPDFLQYINHSCSPNIFFNTTTMELVCLQPIQPGDEFTFFYPSTEWEMAQPFVCNCGTAGMFTINKRRFASFC